MRKKAYHARSRDDLEPRRAPLHGIVPARRRSRLDIPYKPLAVRTLAEQPMDLPSWRLDHLVRMTDSAGMLQHASATIPNFAEGYCTDDNARALLLTVQLEQLGQSSGQINRLADDLLGILELRIRPESRTVSQLPRLRSPLARGSRIRRLPRASALGAGRLRRPLAPPRPAALGVAALRPCLAEDHRHHLAARLGFRHSGGLPLPATIRRRAAARPGARHPDRAADRML